MKLVALLVLLPTIALAQNDRVVVIAPQDTPMVRRLSDEVRALGLTPVPLAMELGDPAQIEAIAQEHGSRAAIAISQRDRRLRVCIVDRASGGVLVHEVPIGEEEDADTLAALRAAELLRASLIELHEPEPEVVAEPVVAPELPVPMPAPTIERHVLGIEIGPSVGGTPSGPDPMFQIKVGASLRAHRWVSIALSSWIPVHPVSIVAAEGRADLFGALLGVSARVPFFDDDALIQPYAGAGVLGAFVTTRGSAMPPFVGTTSDALSAGPMLELGARLAIANAIGIRLDLMGAVLATNVAIRFASRAVTSFGQPILSLSIGLDVRV
jgi:hypothetical protein